MGERLRALMLCYFFPPKGGAGVQRSAKFVRYLPEEGVDPVVVTGAARSEGAWEPLDESLSGDVPAEVPVHRPRGEAPPPGRASRLDRWLGRPRPFDSWWRATALELGIEAARAHRPDVVYASLSPFSTWEAALELGRRLDLPVVVDLRDPWGLDDVLAYPSRWHRARVLRAMADLVGRTTTTVWNTPEAQRVARAAFPRTPPERQAVLTNGYDRADFEGPDPAPDPGAFRIVHAGTLHAALAESSARRGRLGRLLGGERDGVDHLGRTPRYLLEALGKAPPRASDGRPVELHLLGGLSPADERLLARFPDAPVVRHGFVPHDETTRALRGADLLFLPMYGLPPGRRARIVPGKTYEYLAAGPPVLAGVPEGDASDFVRAAGAGRPVRPDDVAGLATALEEHLQGPRPSPADPRRARPEVHRFERRALTRTLAEILRAART